MSYAKTGTLRVKGASLYYRARGEGPLLLLLQGGDGDADGAGDLVAHLTDHYTVVTHDRRGLSRSAPDDPAQTVGLQTHADDAHQLLAALTDEPVTVAGFSIGAVIGLDLAARYPGQVHTLIAHEPPLVQLLAYSEWVRVEQAREGIRNAYKQEGMAAALLRFMAMAGVKIDDLEPGAALAPMTDSRAATLRHFLTYDAPCVQRYVLDFDLLRTASAEIIPTVGSTSRGFFPHRFAEELASFLRKPVAEFPGAHTGYVTHPSAFAAKLHEILSGTHRVPAGAGVAGRPARSG